MKGSRRAFAGEDEMCWALECSSDFSAKSLVSSLVSSRLELKTPLTKFIWNFKVPK